MSFELKETEENKNYLIAKLEQNDEEYYFIHNKEDGKNYFNRKVLSEMFDVDLRSISYHTKQIEEKMGKTKNFGVALKLSHSTKPVQFYGFSVVRYLASRINTEKAFAMCEWIDDALNEKYNQQQGLSKPKLKNPLKQRIKKAVYSKNHKIGKAYSLYHELNNIGYDKSAKMVYHQLKLDEADRDVLREAFTLVDKAEDILKKEEEPSTQTKLVEGE